MQKNGLNFIKTYLELKRVIDRAGTGKRGEKSVVDIKNQILFTIREHGENGTTPGEIMDEVKIVKTNLAIACCCLEQEGEIIKKKSTVDARSVIYFLTEKGKERVEKLSSLASQKFRDILTENEFNELNTLCEKIYKLLN